jgi:hypothetical protein
MTSLPNLEGLSAKDQRQAVKTLIARLTRQLVANERKMDRLEDERERLITQRNQAVSKMAWLENQGN